MTEKKPQKLFVVTMEIEAVVLARDRNHARILVWDDGIMSEELMGYGRDAVDISEMHSPDEYAFPDEIPHGDTDGRTIREILSQETP